MRGNITDGNLNIILPDQTRKQSTKKDDKNIKSKKKGDQLRRDHGPDEMWADFIEQRDDLTKK